MNTPVASLPPGAPVAPTSGAATSSTGADGGGPFAALVEQALAEQASGEHAADSSAGAPLTVDVALFRAADVLFAGAPEQPAVGSTEAAPLTPSLLAAMVMALPSDAVTEADPAAAANARALAGLGSTGPTGAVSAAAAVDPDVVPAPGAPAGTVAAASLGTDAAATAVLTSAVAGARPAIPGVTTGGPGATGTPAATALAAAAVPGAEETGAVPVAVPATTAAAPATAPVPPFAVTAIPTGMPGDAAADPSQIPADRGAASPGEATAPSPTAAQVAAPTGPAPAASTGAPAAAAAHVPTPAAQLVPHIAPLREGPDGTHSLTVRLSPDELGPVQVRVEVRQGVLSLELVGASELARETLRASLSDLRRELGGAGITTGSFDVRGETGGRGGAQGGDFGRSDQGGAGGNRGGNSGGDTRATEAPAGPFPVRPSGPDSNRALDLSL